MRQDAFIVRRSPFPVRRLAFGATAGSGVLNSEVF